MATRGLHRLTALLCATALGPVALAAESQWEYGKRGLEWSDPATGTYLWLGLRGQVRYVSDESSFRLPGEFDRPVSSGTSVNRSRYKIGARVFEDLTFYHEYDLRGSRLLDLRTTWVSNPGFNFRVGQWKADYNRERIES